MKIRKKVRAIPPITSTGQSRIERGGRLINNAFKGKQIKKQICYSEMKTSSLNNLLAYAEDLFEKAKGAVKFEPTNKNLDNLDFLEKSINQLKTQLLFRR